MDLEQLRTQWNKIELPTGEEASRVRELERRVRDNRVTTLRDKLSRLTFNLVLVSVFGLLTIVPLGAEGPTLMLAAAAFFVLMGLMNFYRALYIRRFNPAVMTVSEALRTVYMIEKQKMISKIIGVICAVPLVIYMAMTFADIFGPWALYGVLAGILVGGCIGLLLNHRANMLLREMKRQLQE